MSKETTAKDAFYHLTPEYQANMPWFRVADAFFDNISVAAHQIDSFNVFMREKLPEIITNSVAEYTKDDKRYCIGFSDLYVKKPEFTEPSGVKIELKPIMCMNRDLTYGNRVHVDIHRYELGPDEKVLDQETFSEVFLGEIPCMLHSEYCHLHGKDYSGLIRNDECPRDAGGFFIVNGQQKVLISQDRMAHNEIFVFKSKEKDSIKLPVPGQDKNCSIPCAWWAEVRSFSTMHEPNITNTHIKLSDIQLDKGEEQRLYVELPGFKSPVAWPIVFKALGIEDTDEMCNFVCAADDIPMLALLMPSLECPKTIVTRQDALDYLVDFVSASQQEQRMPQLLHILNEKMFQNASSISEKRYQFGYMTNQLLSTALGRRTDDDRDHLGKKRVDTSGSLMNNLVKSMWKRIIHEITLNISKKRTNDLGILFDNKLGSCLKIPFATGNWNTTRTPNPSKIGISQILNRHNLMATISNLRRVSTPNDKNSKIIKPRHLHGSQWLFLCPAETPEGATAGLIKNLALISSLSLGSPDEIIIDWLKTFSKLVSMVSESNIKLSKAKNKVFVNGRWVAITEDPKLLVVQLRKLRREGKICREVSISANDCNVRIYTDEGRMLVPLFVVENGSLKKLPETFNWETLLEQGIVEYVDPMEVETLYHSVYPWTLNKEHTHSVIHPAFIYGSSANTAPFLDHNQSPRNIYQSAMGKQAIGVHATNFLKGTETNAHILCYPQRPLINTWANRKLGGEELPTGQNLVVGVLAKAYNQEDSVVVNQRSLDNGALRSMNYVTYGESCHRKGTTCDEIRRPERTSVKETRLKGYSKLDTDGLSKEGTPISKRDVVVGKVSSGPEMVRDTSVVVKTNGLEEDSVVELTNDNGDPVYEIHAGSAVVDKTIVTINNNLSRTVKVVTRQMRIPIVGDKVASRSAQKGILGRIVAPEDMLYSEVSGISPDLIMNPHAYPSRMTMAQPLETYLGKAAAATGSYIDCTAFSQEFKSDDQVIETTEELMAEYGLEKYGDEIMINGKTGEQMEVTLFMGPTYYQRLKHMVDDKIHSRDSDGPRETLTRQPVEGRKRNGGFRMGEMETWCGISHGASKFLIDRLVNNSDGYEMYVCNLCGNPAIATISAKRFECKRCQQDIKISKIRLPYAFKLIMQELQACGMGLWINVDETKTLAPPPTPSH